METKEGTILFNENGYAIAAVWTTFDGKFRVKQFAVEGRVTNLFSTFQEVLNWVKIGENIYAHSIHV